jgi:hypothetical protein
MPICDSLKVALQFLRSDPEKASEGTGQAFRLPLHKPMSAKSLPELLDGRPIHPRRGTIGQNDCLANSFQFRQSRVTSQCNLGLYPQLFPVALRHRPSNGPWRSRMLKVVVPLQRLFLLMLVPIASFAAYAVIRRHHHYCVHNDPLCRRSRPCIACYRALFNR